jgi:hypothetical protein
LVLRGNKGITAQLLMAVKPMVYIGA